MGWVLVQHLCVTGVLGANGVRDTGVIIDWVQF